MGLGERESLNSNSIFPLFRSVSRAECFIYGAYEFMFVFRETRAGEYEEFFFIGNPKNIL